MRARSSRASIRPTRDVVGSAEIVADEILEDDAHVSAQHRDRTLADRGHRTGCDLRRIVEAGEKLHERRLAGAVLANQRANLAGMQR